MIKTFEERRFCVRRHDGDEATVDETRRPMYQHMISHELVGGPPVLRFPIDQPDVIEVLIGATCDFDGDHVVSVDVLPAGDYLVEHYDGPPSGVRAARDAFRRKAMDAGGNGDVLQVHLMDEIDGDTEQEFQALIE